MQEATGGNNWLRALVAYLVKWIDSNSLATDSVPVVWVNGPKSAIHGSPNQKWLEVACGLLTGDPWWIDFTIQHYGNEFSAGHQEIETLTGSHAWQHLDAHTAIRYALKVSKPLAQHVDKDKLAKLVSLNNAWWANEAWLMKMFYSHVAKGCVSVGARNQAPGFCRSSQKDAIASYIVGASNHVPLPKHLDATDVYCQVLADKLVRLGDHLEKDNAVEPKLWSPVYSLRKGDDIYSYWTPPHEVIGPALYAECVNGKTDYKFEPTVPDNHGDYKQMGAGRG